MDKKDCVWNHSMRSLWIVLPYGPNTDEIICNKKQSAWVVTVQRALNWHGKGKSSGSWTQDLSLIKPPALCHRTTTDPTASYVTTVTILIYHISLYVINTNKMSTWTSFTNCGFTSIHRSAQLGALASTMLARQGLPHPPTWWPSPSCTCTRSHNPMECNTQVWMHTTHHRNPMMTVMPTYWRRKHYNSN